MNVPARLPGIGLLIVVANGHVHRCPRVCDFSFAPTWLLISPPQNAIMVIDIQAPVRVLTERCSICTHAQVAAVGVVWPR